MVPRCVLELLPWVVVWRAKMCLFLFLLQWALDSRSLHLGGTIFCPLVVETCVGCFLNTNYFLQPFTPHKNYRKAQTSIFSRWRLLFLFMSLVLWLPPELCLYAACMPCLILPLCGLQVPSTPSRIPVGLHFCGCLCRTASRELLVE